MTSPPPNPTPPTGAMLRPGDVVDPYTVKRQVGSGGHSVVFKATDELLNKHVAIKQFLLSDSDDEVTLRNKIMTEAKLHQKAAAADPERLVQVVDVEDSPHGLLLISEYVSGPSLEQILAQNTAPMNLKQALGIIAAVAQALDSIHGRGIVHLDLKPANILMPRAGGLKLSDFGLAATFTEQTPPTTGTVRYMSPELLNNEKVDGRADLYALGILAYEMIAGRANFDQAFKLILKDQRNQAVRWVKWHTNPRAQAPPLTDFVPDLPPAIAELIQRLMAKDPQQRTASAKDVLAAIKRHFAGKPTAPDDDTIADGFDDDEATSPGDTAALPARSGLLRYGLIAAVLLVLASVAAGVFVFSQHRAERRQVLDDARKTMDQATQAYKDGRYEQAIAGFDRLSPDPDVQATYGRHAEAGKLLAEGRLHFEQGDYDAALAAYRRAADLGDRYHDSTRPLISEAQQAQAFAETTERIDRLITGREFGEARKELDAWRDLSATEQEQQALRSLGAKLEDQVARWRVQGLMREARALADAGRRTEAIELLQSGPQKREVADLLAQLEAESAAERAVAQADAALDRGDPEEAIRQLETATEALPTDEALRRRLTEVRTDWLVEEGLRMLAQGNTVGADERLTEALGYQPNNQRARDALKQIASSSRREAFIEAGDAAASRGDYETAIRQYENALQLGVDDPLGEKLTDVRVRVLLRQARASLENGDVEKAGELVNQASQLAPQGNEVAAVRRDVQVRGEYVRHLNAGDEALSRSSFGEAKRHYLKAKEAMDTPAVRTRLDEAEFDHLLAQARDYLAAEEYASARAQLQIASGLRQSDEVAQLMQQVRDAEAGAQP